MVVIKNPGAAAALFLNIFERYKRNAKLLRPEDLAKPKKPKIPKRGKKKSKGK
ncbi:MAG: hypothetical protein AAB627_00925 [Patescibacteria group bacterium]